MLSFPYFQDIDFEPLWEEGINHKIALKHELLFALVEGRKYAIVEKERMADALNYLAKLDLDYAVATADRESFERLKNKFLEIQTGSEFEEMSTTTEDLIEVESDLLEFIRNSQDLLSSEASAPIIKLVNSLFFQALQKEASDIHIESQEHKGEVRLRIDGALKKHLDLDKMIIGLVINRIKVISNLDISEKRVPQDGRTQISISGKTLDVRVSVLPTYHELYKLLSHAHGMILVTGPTGSGKSTTLHACLQHIATPDKNIITVEDPVEYNADNISQIQVNEKVGLTFSAGLRSILRQDPDIIMVGEIRDSETADIALRSALTGHLLLSTLHTNDATSSLSRLMDMGVENFLISSTLLGVLAQRLARKLCEHCKQEVNLPSSVTDELGLPSEHRYFGAKGCKHCDFTGYKGRQAIGELFLIDDEVKTMMKDGFNDHQIREAMKQRGMRTISDKLKEMLLAGTTSYEEAIRVGLMDG